MKSITIHNIEDELEALIVEKSKKEGTSLNKTIKKLLRKALNISKDEDTSFSNFSEFLGIWEEEEYKEFETKISDFEKIEKEDWQ
ncbi:MAG: hypothetical protein OEZ22_10975 [Spirochaetia bacterium]|nr:hypothetical protein [Spirochaetia bacterium]